MNRVMIGAVMWMVVALGLPLRGADVTVGQLDRAFSGLTTFKIGGPTTDVDLIRSSVTQYAKQETRRADLEARLIQVLKGQATWEAKDFACRQLFIIGTEASVPALSSLLADAKLSFMARAVLEKIPGEASLQALRQALSQATGDTLKTGLIHSLGRRGDVKSIDAFIQSAKSGQPELAGAAITALSRVPDDRAAEAVVAAYGSAGDKTRSVAGDAVMTLAARLASQGKPDKAGSLYERLYNVKEPATLRMGAMQGLVSLGGDRGTAVLFQALADSDARMQAAALTTLRQATSVPVATIGERMVSLPAPSQAKVILALADRGPSSRPIVMAAAKNKDVAVRTAAVQTLGSVGDASCVGLLAEIAVSNDGAAEASRTSLVRMVGDGINAAIVNQIKTAKPDVQVQLVNVLAGRNAKETAPSLLALAASDNPQVRRSGLAALKRLAGEQEARPLARLLAKGVADSEAEDAQAATLVACRAITDTAGQAAPVINAFAETPSVAGKVSLLRVMAGLGGKAALVVVQAASNDPKKEIKDAAIRALVEWPDAGPIQTVRKLAESADDPTHRVLALRGFIRMIELADLSDADMLRQYDAAIKMATRPDEKRQALAKIANMPSEAALKMAQALAADPALAGDATAAVAKIDKALKHPARCEASTAADVDKAVDGDPATRWTTGAPMQGGEWFLIDLGGERTVRKVTLDCARSDGDYARGYEVYVSNSKVRLGKPVAAGKGEAQRPRSPSHRLRVATSRSCRPARWKACIGPSTS